MKNLIFALSLSLLSLPALALSATTVKASDVPIIKTEDQINFTNIPSIFKQFPGAKDAEQKSKKLEECKNWVENTLTQEQAEKVYKYWCAVRADIVMREYEITGYILFKNW